MKFLLILVIGFGGWQYYTSNNTDNKVGHKPSNFSQIESPIPKKTYECDGRQHCSQMNSYVEAKYFNDFCPDTKMDGDNDGIPCERQFNK